MKGLHSIIEKACLASSFASEVSISTTPSQRYNLTTRPFGLRIRQGPTYHPSLFTLCLTGEQTVDNSCATVAMLNILMNSPGIELGPELTRFKDQSQDMNSVQRGKLLSENTAIRVQHNLLSRYFTSSSRSPTVAP